MKNQRILAYEMSQKLSDADLQDVAAGGTSVGTLQYTHGQGGSDSIVDATIDM